MIKKIAKIILLQFGLKIQRIRKVDVVGKNGTGLVNEYDKLKSYIKQYSEDVIKLHIGCGPRILKGWVNIDLAYEPFENYLPYYGEEFYSQDVRGKREEFFGFNLIEHGLPFSDESIDFIFHEDFIEHLSQRDQFVFLAETLRVLKPGGMHRVNTPELLSSMELGSDFNKGGKGVFVQEWDSNGHLNVLTDKILEEMEKIVGYSTVIFNSRDNSICNCIPKEYRPDPSDRPESGNIFADLVK